MGEVKGTIKITMIPSENPKQAPRWKAELKDGKLTTTDGAVQDIEGGLDSCTLGAEVAPWPERNVAGDIRLDFEQPNRIYKLRG